MNESQVEKILDRAIDAINENGWCRNTLMDDNGHVCMLGALEIAQVQMRNELVDLLGNQQDAYVRSIRLLGEAERRIAQLLKERDLRGALLHKLPADMIPEWNDYRAKDADEVIEVLKLAKEQS